MLDHVAFSYPGAAEPVLSDISLELSPGETVALAGATGSGKTTLLYLVARLAEVTAGSIRLDGTDIRDLPLPVLRTAVACAFEDPTLFSVSVRENVALGAPGADDQAIKAALAAAQADFVWELPWGLDTRIGEQGMSLSGGQRQRIALARAILAGPSVLLLDDPLSALDVHTEAKVTAALGQTLARSTALVVAHRPSTVALADRVAVLDRGVISAIGTHRELLGTSQRYRYLMSREGGAAGPETGAHADEPGQHAVLARYCRRERRRPAQGHLAAAPQAQPGAAGRPAPVAPVHAGADRPADPGGQPRRAGRPWLVGVGVDRIPELLRTQNPVPIIIVVVEFSVAIIVQAAASAGSSRRSAGWAGRSCLSCAAGCSRTSSGCRCRFTSTTPPAG